MDSNVSWVADHLIIHVDISSAEVNDNVNYKHDVHNEVNYIEGVTWIAAVCLFLLLVFIKQEGSWVGSEDSCVDDQQ